MVNIEKMAVPSNMGERNRAYADYFNQKLGGTPNLLRTMMLSDNALSAYYPFHTRKSSLKREEGAAISLAIAGQHGASYCLHTYAMIAKLNGFSEMEISEMQQGAAPFNTKLDALLKLSKALAVHPNSCDEVLLDAFFAVGYRREQLLDTLLVIGDCFITNLLGKVFAVPLD